MTSLAADHAACAAILGRSGSSFALPIRLLPEAKRQGTTALYAFCRIADDVVDDAPDQASAATGLAALEAATAAALAGHGSEMPVLRAVVDTVRRYGVPHECLTEILAGVRMDLTQTRYDTITDLEQYCGRVASAVGIAAVHIWGFTDADAVRRSHDCGVAFQLTNILRDIPEDLRRGRIYLPREDFAACGVTDEDLLEGRIGPGFADLARLEIDRATARFARASAIDRMLCTDSRATFRAMFGVYRSLLAAVERAGVSIFTARVRPSKSRLLGAAGVAILGGIGGRRR